MQKYKIKKDKKNIKSNFEIKCIKNTISEHEKSDMVKLIEYFNYEYDWKDMFNINDVLIRIETNQTLFLLYYNKIAIGYVWFKEIDKDVCFGYNLYVTNKEKRPSYSAYWFYTSVTDYMLLEYNTIEVEVENWHTTIKDIIETIGYYE